MLNFLKKKAVATVEGLLVLNGIVVAKGTVTRRQTKVSYDAYIESDGLTICFNDRPLFKISERPKPIIVTEIKSLVELSTEEVIPGIVFSNGPIDFYFEETKITGHPQSREWGFTKKGALPKTVVTFCEKQNKSWRYA